ncbi:sodium-dependent multivitamin transporter isoform X2 [Aplysia californica]|uniref:Sodium-dependent multivitamin transporter isoform X2 n=1 Tax=Aplysia californica TaxID=6500 RepID=A0ABM0ZXW9_APLCA|nr:sodium-dependent multivitamin transporter isoform X2 [Aplysia californica]
MASAARTFSWEDYVVFSCMLFLSSCIGLFFGIRAKTKKQASADELLTGNRKLPLIPVALSLSASFTSATTILGIPAEVYTRGGEQWLWALGMIPCFLIVGFFIVPIIYKLQLTNAYEYLELRFSKAVRTIGSFSFSIIIVIYMAAVLYAPSVALSQVTGLDPDVSIVAIGLVCTVYTSFGGIRGVVWTDAFQLIIVWAGLLALMFKGASDVGGWSKVWEISRKGDRLPRFDMDPDPFIRHTFWTLLVGGGTNMMTVYGANQTNLQRYSSVSSLRKSKIALLLNLPLWICYLSILSLLGLVMFAYFDGCDPLGKEMVSKTDQLLPLFVLETMGSMPGLPGLFIASVFSASISTLSSGINSLGAVTLEDVFKPLYEKCKKKSPSQMVLTIATIVLVFVFGGLTIFLAKMASLLGKTALTISFGVFGMVGGPLLGLMINGMFIPFINKWGAMAGWLASLVLCLYVGIDPVFNPGPKGYLPLDSESCSVDFLNSSNMSMTTTPVMLTTTFLNGTTNATTPAGGSADSDHLYLSYLHYSTLALLVSAIVGMLVSALTGCNKGKDVDERTYYKYPCCFRQRNGFVEVAQKESRNQDFSLKTIG